MPDTQHITTRDEIFMLGLLIALGMTCGFFGDLFMAGILKAGNPVLNGMLSFGIGHIFYITGLYHFGVVTGYTDSSALLGAFLFWGLFALCGWYIVVYHRARRTQSISILHLAALPYAFLLSGTAAVSSGLALQAPEFIPIAIGSGLFLLSDLILAGQLFNGLKFHLISDFVWFTYSPGQMLIVMTIPMLSVLQSILY